MFHENHRLYLIVLQLFFNVPCFGLDNGKCDNKERVSLQPNQKFIVVATLRMVGNR